MRFRYYFCRGFAVCRPASAGAAAVSDNGSSWPIKSFRNISSVLPGFDR